MMNRHGPDDCPVCHGKECWGGGNARCVQRDHWPSQVAAILDSYGGSRVVVDYDFDGHLRASEFLIVVPNLVVFQPIAWGDIPGCVGRAEHELKQWAERNERSNDDATREAIVLWRLRCLEQNQRSLDLEAICYT